jgi:SAM-dependent methyltransferase
MYTSRYDLASHFEPWSKRKRVIYERRLDQIGSPVGEANRLCDVGCGDGQFLELAAARGWDPSGVELNPPAALRARERGAHVWEGGVESLDDLPWGSFDLVTAWDAIEHTPTPREFATRMSHLAKPRATLALSTLNASSLVARTFGNRWSMIVEDHYTYWHPRSLTRLLTSCGWEAPRSRTLGVGRDFFLGLDSIIERLKGNPGSGDGASIHQPHARASTDWGTGRVGIGVERLLNTVLSATNTGVSLEVFATAPYAGRR